MKAPLPARWQRLFEEAELGAYCCRVDRGQKIPMVGDRFSASVTGAFCCAVGETFWLADTQEIFGGEHSLRCMQARLLEILNREERETRIVVDILQIKEILSFLKPVPDSLKTRLTEYRVIYSALGPDTDTLYPNIEIKAPWTQSRFTMGGGDLEDLQWIYTDPEGIDHLSMVFCYDGCDAVCLVGDRVLGRHSDSFWQWEDGWYTGSDRGVFDQDGQLRWE